MQNNIQELLISLLNGSLKRLGIEEFLRESLYLDFPADDKFGDLSTNIAMRLSKPLKKSPLEIAKSIINIFKEELENSPAKPYVKEIKPEGAGFINFYLTEAYFYEQLKSIVLEGSDAFRVDLGRGQPVMIEFVSANPTGPLSVAHARQAAVGDSLANILEFLKFKVSREYYLNDEGNQINILGASVSLRLKELEGETVDFPENHYQGDYIFDIAKRVRSQKSEVRELGDFAADHILEIIKKELDDFGIRFDCWYSQKALAKSGKIGAILEELKKRGFIYELDGAVWLKSTSFGDDKDRVVIKSDKSYTYLAPDIAYHEEKYRRGFSWLINLWGPDHHGYISRLKAAIEALGHSPDSLSVVIVQLATIFKNGKSIEMSTRKGQYITLREVLDEVGKDAARFFFLMRRTSSHLDFDLDAAKKETSENPVFYIQYAYARICSILRSSGKEINKSADINRLKEKEELALIKKLLQLSIVLNICLKTQDPYMLTVYLQELSETFHKFYDLHRVLGTDETLVQARLVLCEAARIALALGLGLLGVSKPEKM